MLQRLILLTSSVVVSCLSMSSTVEAMSASVQNTVPNSVVVPIASPPPIPQLEPTLPGFDVELPDANSEIARPRYQEQPVPPIQQTLRLEIRLSRRQVTVYRGRRLEASRAML